MKRLVTFLAGIVMFCCIGNLQAQKNAFMNGYERTLKGGGFQYHSPIPGVGTSMLVRSLDSLQYVEWTTSPVSLQGNPAMVSIIWIFGIDANPDSHPFRLFINGTYCLTFTNPVTSEKKSFLARGILNSTLEFRPTMLDKYADPMGYAILTVPASMIRNGEAQVLRIQGETGGSRSWYMTFEAPVTESFSIIKESSLIRGNGGNLRRVWFQFVNPGDARRGAIRIEGMAGREVLIETGFNNFSVLFPESSGPETINGIFTVSGRPDERFSFTIDPPYPWEIYLVQHTHTDIGYTRPQTEILPEHLRYLDYALDFCDQTDSLPDDARFRWTCETSWAVGEYLKTRPREQIERLRKRVKENRIEIAAMFVNGSDLSDEPMVALSLQSVKMIRDSGFSVRSAMQSDINGVPWCLADYLPVAGIGILNMAQNTHRALKPFNVPTAFWWESPSGNRLLVNRPEHYMMGNNLGILTNLDTFGKNLLDHLDDIRKRGYGFHEYAIQFSGYLTDNSPPSTTACELVRKWNEQYVWPRLRLATLSEFPAIIRTKYGNDLPVIRGAWPDWWMDGFGSAAIPTAYARKTHADFIAGQGLASFGALIGAPPGDYLTDEHRRVAEELIFYDEHTFGAAESISDPLCENSVVQIGLKESYIWSAVKREHIFREGMMGRIQPLLPRCEVPSLIVINTLDFTRTANAIVYIDHQIIPEDRGFAILDGSDTVLVQPLSRREDGTYWLVRAENIPPMGYKSYRIVTAKTPRIQQAGQPFNGILENEFYRIEFDQSEGRIKSLVDRELNRQLLDQNAPWPLGTVIYERLGNNRSQLEQLRLEDFSRRQWTGIRFGELKNGPVWTSLTLIGELTECADPSGVTLEIRLYHDEKKIEFAYSMKKLPVISPEAVYVAFPFRLEGAHFMAEVSGGTMNPEITRIPGSASDWTGIQNFVAVRNTEAQIVLSSPEIPLVHLGDINLGKFERVFKPASQAVYSWVLNNYWTTNFFASQEGELRWTYQLTSSGDPSNALATRFGWNARIPLITRVFPAAAKPPALPVPNAYLPEGNPGILMVCTYPSANGKEMVLQLRETAGKSDSLLLMHPAGKDKSMAAITGATMVNEVNVVFENLKTWWTKPAGSIDKSQPVWLPFKPNETKFIRLTW